jgi:hypothetical protein
MKFEVVYHLLRRELSSKHVDRDEVLKYLLTYLKPFTSTRTIF